MGKHQPKTLAEIHATMLTESFSLLPNACYLTLSPYDYLKLYDAIRTLCPGCRKTHKARVEAFKNFDHTEIRRLLICPNCKHVRTWP